MNYCLRVIALGHPLKVELTQSEFEELKYAKNILTKFFNFTENYRVAVESYRAVEKAKHEAELNHMLYSDFGYKSLADTRVVLNAPIVGYLSSSRYFLDSTDKFLSKILSEQEANIYKDLRGEIYDSTPQYAFIEALRNYVQHRELPIHNITYHKFIEDKKENQDREIITALSIATSREILRKDKKFKQEAIKDMPDSINIISCIRHHLEGLWKLRKYIMDTYSYKSDTAREKVSESIDRYEQETSDEALGLNAVAYEEEYDIKESVPLLLNWDDARISSEARIGNLNNLHKRYVSGKNH